MSDHVLEPAAQRLAAAWTPPWLDGFGAAGARQALADIQARPVDRPDADARWVTIACDHGDVRACIVTPVAARRPLPTVLYLHGGGWVLGDAGTHDRLMRELAVGAQAAVVFVEYDRSPEAQYPVAVEQAYSAARWIAARGADEGLDDARLAIAGDCVGANMAAAVTILAKQRADVTFLHQSLYYPVTDAGQDTGSYRDFAGGPYLTARSMAWFWDCYLPEVAVRAEIAASPLRASLDELTGLPPALVIVAENDVVRDEGEAYARRLTAAGVRTTSVRFNGALHDFMMLNPVRGTAATSAAVELAITTLRKVFAQ